MNKKLLAFLFAIFLLGFFLRTVFLPSLSLTFGYDQARDAVHAEEISQGHLKILGPPASTPGLFHGVFYYYVLAPAYKLGKGNPIAAAYWIATINASVIFIVYFLTYLMTKKKISRPFSKFSICNFVRSNSIRNLAFKSNSGGIYRSLNVFGFMDVDKSK